MTDPVYLDYAATTPVRREVREAMDPYLSDTFGNSGSAHRWGRAAQAAIEEARATIAESIGARRREVFFVRGGTESDNLAILGRAEVARAQGRPPVIVVPATEHKAVLDAAHSVEEQGGRCLVLPVDRDGLVDLDALDRALTESPAVVSCMWVNNETGVVQPIADVAARCEAAGVPLHTDAVQAVGKRPVRVDEVPVSMLSLTGHKIYGPKSAGALFVREGTELHARLHGGGQEAGIRPGTLDTCGIVGLATAVRLAVAERETFLAHVTALRDRLVAGLRAAIPELVVHGEGAPRAGHVVNVGIPGLPREMLVISLDMEGVAASGGSACTTGAPTVSHVLGAMYGSDSAVATPIRFSFGRATTRGEVDRAVEATIRVVERLRSLAPAS